MKNVNENIRDQPKTRIWTRILSGFWATTYSKVKVQIWDPVEEQIWGEVKSEVAWFAALGIFDRYPGREQDRSQYHR